jgi:hypothetical protein
MLYITYNNGYVIIAVIKIISNSKIIIYHDQEGLIPGMQGRLNTHNVYYYRLYINSLKKKSHMIIINCFKKACDKNSTSTNKNSQ